METWQDASASERRQFELISMIFSNHPKLLDFFFDPFLPRICGDPVEVIEEAGCFSSGEQVLIRVALDLWSRSGDTKICDVFERLDQDNLNKVLKALMNWYRSGSAN